ncbi:bifunctional diaminohydroxyphosphoribosylaminopyrimidine deaminase/5-amino-6-(5-phosphoribosylamino)uracil reductase RibD [Altericroceibacterium spongiae]|uniref:Riboflavin biosynthesis protein RibD n=1 Tax=Altericroceibacterium spongiae TaxID=2320269 RepID=A0A420EJE8_9SPHN|nr:bifunctional diaminohydroxyphosphoribosylaminopyrimidine deaminase/5-amino-6-(5-phosphoribosylamino)uracil reductase RibD [Altericroceibacterium spongiae]
MAAAAALAERGRPLSRPNPAVGAIIVANGPVQGASGPVPCPSGPVVGQGWTQPGGRPHAEAMALEQAGNRAKGATLYVTLEPCAHRSTRGPACADLVSKSGLSRVIIGTCDPDPRTAGQGITHIQQAGIAVTLAQSKSAEDSLSGYLRQRLSGRPHVTLKLALSLDGMIALGNGESRWITGPEARAHTHRERARADAILVGGGTLRADNPRLDVRLPGLEKRSPQRLVLTGGAVPTGWHAISEPAEICGLEGIQYLFIEGGAQTAAAFLKADLVDRLLLYRAPILIGGGQPSIADLGLTGLAAAHHRWTFQDRRQLGSDTLEIYERNPCLPA